MMGADTAATKRDFNPHSHAGSDAGAFCLPKNTKISIHTPTQGVTSDTSRDCYCRNISIHTPTQGVTSSRSIKMHASTISIHTPTQGVTKHACIWSLCNCDFNPHSHAGSDLCNDGSACQTDDFNPHSHAGSDRDVLIFIQSYFSFQSTLPRRE